MNIPTRVFVVVGHPRDGSFCEALAEAYLSSLPAACERRVLRLSAANFDPDVRYHSPNDQTLEPDLVQARDAILWANHLVFVFPTWWGTMPARLKGFLDRLFSAGFAFEERGNSYEPLLRGRTAHLIVTMDTPPLVYRLIFGSPGTRALARSTFWFCGIAPARVTRIGPVKPSSMAQREAWLNGVAKEAAELPRWRAFRQRLTALFSWMKIARLQFYAMTLLAYGLGAALAAHSGLGVNWHVFWLGFAALFLVEFASVLTNEEFDLPSDRANRQYGPFNGGSRVLVQGLLSIGSVRKARWAALTGAALCGLAIALLLPVATLIPSLVLFALGLVLGIGYTAPPIRLAWRGLGEIDVAVSHSIYMLLCGWILQGGSAGIALPWIVSVPMALAIFASILLAGIPDRDADRQAGKETLVVKLGTRRAAILAGLSVVAAAGTGMLFHWLAGGILGLLAACFLLHTGAILYRLFLYWRDREGCRRIDGLMTLALSYVLWFSLVPLIMLLG